MFLTDVFNLDTQYYWHEKTFTKKILMPLFFLEDFSYGDRLRAGVIAANSPIIKDVQKIAEKGIPILGVCNGFQNTCRIGDFSLEFYSKMNLLIFMCEWTNLIVENNNTPFTNQFSASR